MKLSSHASASMSRWFVGSSSMSISGSVARRRARESLVYCPPESVLIFLFIVSSSKPSLKSDERHLLRNSSPPASVKMRVSSASLAASLTAVSSSPEALAAEISLSSLASSFSLFIRKQTFYYYTIIIFKQVVVPINFA